MNREIRILATLAGLCIFVVVQGQTAWGQEQRKVKSSAPPAKPAGAVTSVSQGTGIVATPNPIVSTGTIAIDPNVVPQLGVANAFTATQTISTGNLVISSGDLALPDTGGSTSGVVDLGGSAFLHAFPGGTSQNTFLGKSAGNFTMSGGANTGLGAFALESVTVGGGNTAVGAGALGDFTGDAGSAGTFNNNTAVGSSALVKSNAGGNTAIGALALSETTSGNGNTGFGVGAGGILGNTDGYNQTGSFNTFVGWAASPESGHTDLTNATAIGAHAVVSESNALVLGAMSGVNQGTSVNVGIGTAAPAATLHVAGGDVYVSTVGNGVILKSPDGTKCARISLDNSGALVTTAVACL